MKEQDIPLPKATSRPDYNVPPTQFDFIPGKQYSPLPDASKQPDRDMPGKKFISLGEQDELTKLKWKHYTPERDIWGDIVEILWYIVFIPLMIVFSFREELKRQYSKLLNYMRGTK